MPKNKNEYTGFRNGDLFCYNCGKSGEIKLPLPIPDYVAAMNKFAKEHKKCPKTWTQPIADPSLSENERAIWWITNGEHGTSSMTMYAELIKSTDIVFNPEQVQFLVRCNRSDTPPHDADDFRRCYLLLQTVPEWRTRLLMLKKISPVWERLVGNWNLLTTLLEEQLSKPEEDRNATELYNLMKSIGC
jgi:hypothetical protein